MSLEDNIDHLLINQHLFWSRITSEDLEKCWSWDGNLAPTGYGRVYLKPSSGGPFQSILAHRYSWIIHFGPITSGLYICHSCDTRSCTNPLHLFEGTASDNFKDMHAKGRGKSNPPLDYWKGKFHTDETRLRLSEVQLERRERERLERLEKQ